MNAMVKISNHLVFSPLIWLAFFIICCSSAPLKPGETPYSLFLNELRLNNCSIPSQIRLPAPSEENKLEPFSSSLNVCKSNEYKKMSQEASIMCSEILVVLEKIWCLNGSIDLPEINVNFSTLMCKDFASVHSMLPNNSLQLLARSDPFVCELMCGSNFQPTCRVLLWSYKVQNQLNAFGNGEKSGQKATEQGNEIDIDKAKHEIPKPVQTEPNAVESTIGETTYPEHKAKVKSIQSNKGAAIENEVKTLPPKKQAGKSDVKSESQTFVTGKQKTENNISLTEGTPGHEGVDNDAGKDALAQPVDVGGGQVDPQHQENETEVKFRKEEKNNSSDENRMNNQLSALLPDDAQGKPNPEDVPQDEGANEFPEEHDADAQTQTVIAVAAGKNEEKSVPVPVTAASGEVKPKLDAKTVDETKPTDSEKSVGPVPTKPSESPVAEISISEPASVEPFEIPNPTEVAVLEKMEGEGPVDKEDPDQYNGGIYETAKNKESNAKEVFTSHESVQSEMSKSYNEFPSRNSFGRGPQDIQVIAAFPQQEDSHFFFYFLSIVLILMAGYLIFHNKQKIIALIVEGRHERRRRSHGGGYKKLETK